MNSFVFPKPINDESDTFDILQYMRVHHFASGNRDYMKYGIRDGRLVHINDVQSGLKCNCVCPECASRLVARKGQKVSHHFAHYKSADCNHGTETALHIMAKNIISQKKRLFVPRTPKSIYMDDSIGRIVEFEYAEVEKQLSDTLRSDVLLSIDNRFLNVEIKVTHEVDVHKRIELFNFGIPTIEIDLSSTRSNFNADLIEKVILKGTFTKLIFSPKSKDIFAKQLLGEWKDVFEDRYVKNCPFTRSRAYFLDILMETSGPKCHACWGFDEYRDFSGKLLCRGVLGNLNYKEIDKILALEKENGHIRNVELLMTDGSIFKKSF